MYYIIYGALYLFSLLPWWLLYLLSDGVFLLLYYVAGYRRAVVASNLKQAFPEKSDAAREAIAREFYKSFINSFIETLKFISLSDNDFAKRFTGNFELLNQLYATGQNVQLHSGHFFNWEYANWAFSRNMTYPYVCVYLEISNKAFDKLMLQLRSRYNAIMVSTYTFKTKFHQIAKGRYALGLAADQNANPTQGYWLNFFGRLTPFVAGPEKSARINNTAIVYLNYYKVKRGYYHVDAELVTTEPKSYGRGELTKHYVRYLEDCIRKRPANYLWSHRRWKWEYKDEYRKNLLD